MRIREYRKWIRLVGSLSRREHAAFRTEMAALDSIDTGVQAIKAQVNISRCEQSHDSGGASCERYPAGTLVLWA